MSAETKTEFYLITDVPGPMGEHPEMYDNLVGATHFAAATKAHEVGWDNYTIRISKAAAEIRATVNLIDN